MKYRVVAYYETEEMLGSQIVDDRICKIAGRRSNFSGGGMGKRDLGWECDSEIEAKRIERSLRQHGVEVSIQRREASHG